MAFRPNYERKVVKSGKWCTETPGFAEGWAAIPFSYAINQRLYELADELGFEVVYCDNDFKAEKAVSCAELIALQGAALPTISSSTDGSAMGALLDRWIP